MSKPVLGLLAGLALVSAAPLVLQRGSGNAGYTVRRASSGNWWIVLDPSGEQHGGIHLDQQSAERSARLANARGSRNASDVSALQSLLAHLRALRWLYHTTHWQLKGESYYGDHLLFQRLYAGEDGGPNLDDEIDGLGERMTRYFGADSVSDSVILPLTQDAISKVEGSPDLIRRAFALERATHGAIERAYGAIQASGHKTLGLDDFLMALADERDTAAYLLGQRLDEPPSFAPPQQRQQARQQQRQQGSRSACGCGSKNCAGYCGSKNCSCGTR